MMAIQDEHFALTRATTLAEARRLATAWGYWCAYCAWGEPTGRKPHQHGVLGGLERRYRAPPQFHPPEPGLPEANEPHGLAVQRAYARLPEDPYRRILRAEFCDRPWIVPLKEGELESFIARRARVSIGAYEVTLARALLAMANVMKRMGTWTNA